MSDQGKWCKLWASSLDDADLENLSIHEWFCWARFSPYLKAHGKDGKIRLREPGRAIINIFRVSTFQEAIDMIRKFPNFTVEEDESNVSGETFLKQTYSIECKNWSRYQGDFSSNRVRFFRTQKRQSETLQEEKRSRSRSRSRREKEESVTPSGETYPIPHPSTNPINCLVLTFKTTKGFDFDDRAWDRANWSRTASAAKNLLAICRDFKSAESCIKDLGSEYDTKGLSWTLETVCRNAGEWLKRNGRTNADTSRAGLRMAIARRNTEGSDQSGLVKVSAGAVPLAIPDGTDSKNRDEADSKNRTGGFDVGNMD